MIYDYILNHNLFNREQVLSSHEAKQMVAAAQRDMQQRKERMDSDRERQEKELHERLSQRKKAQMEKLVSVYSLNSGMILYLLMSVVLFSHRNLDFFFNYAWSSKAILSSNSFKANKRRAYRLKTQKTIIIIFMLKTEFH